jgi:hypothetical protein
VTTYPAADEVSPELRGCLGFEPGAAASTAIQPVYIFLKFYVVDVART